MAGLGAVSRSSVRPKTELRGRVLDHIQAAGLVDPAAIARAELVSARTGQPVEQVLNQLGGLSDDMLAQAYHTVLGYEVWDSVQRPIAIDPNSVGVTVDFLRRARVAPVALAKEALVCAVCDPLDEEMIAGLRFATRLNIILLVARPSDWVRAFDRTFSPAPPQGPAATDSRRLEREIDQVADNSGSSDAARIVTQAFEAAVLRGASDIHFKPRRNDLNVCLRIDGRLVDLFTAAADLAASVVSRVKVIANLDLGERRLPQDGRTTFVVAGRQVDVRVATAPTVFGESAVLRILDRSSVPLDLDALSLSPNVVSILRQAAQAAHGLFLVSGPTGSGKTTTLYALLQTFAGSAKNVLSVEDPVEYHFEHVSQTQVAPQLGLTFARVLRSFLRQDPDVILVGEIRDPETAAVAVQAAMTGHLVLASVHANGALGVVPRLQDMGVEPYQLAAGFRGAAAQRLVRRLCPHCRIERSANETEIRFAQNAALEAPKIAFEASGCSQCHQSGFKGRIAIVEAYLANEEILRTIADGEPTGALGSIAAACGLRSMAVDGFIKLAEGLTTFEEIMAAVYG